MNDDTGAADAKPLVVAAGGVVSRATASGTLQFLVVHRPRYDDWSLPKGKLEKDETIEDAARREIEEETGFVVELGRKLESSEYVDRHGRPKVVHYWQMTPVGRRAWEPDDEVDETLWITAPEAAKLLSYEHDRRLIAAVGETNGTGATLRDAHSAGPDVGRAAHGGDA